MSQFDLLNNPVLFIIGGMYVGESGSTLIINGQNSSNVAYVL
jgi:hypothetical protein